MRALCLILIVAAPAVAGADDELRLKQTDRLPLGLPKRYSSNNESEELFHLGEKLFYSESLSSKTVSCATCHSPTRYTTASVSKIHQSHKAVRLTRDIPPVFNTYNFSSLMWDGRARGLQDQVLLPLQSKCEMNIDWPSAIRKVNALPETRALLIQRQKEVLSKLGVAEALAEYTSRIVSGNSRFDRYFYGQQNDSLTDIEKQGLSLFRGKARCSSCHNISSDHALLTDGMLHVLGVGYENGRYKDRGFSIVSNDDLDAGAFRTPTLRNITRTAPYMHDGSLQTLDEVIRFYDRGGVTNARNKDRKIMPLKLTAEERQSLKAFLGALESDVYVYTDGT